jgi:pimeloyl-ACP methyl ester carboxylesterase
MFYRGCKTYRPAYKAACTYGKAARRAAEQLLVPAVFTASETDMLHPHLQRLPALRPHQHVRPLPAAPGEKNVALVEYLRELPGEGVMPPVPAGAPVGSNPGKLFVDVGEAQMFVRIYGNAEMPALVIAHDAPGSGLACAALAEELADCFYVVVPDLPGCGESGVLDSNDAILQAGADGLIATAGALGLERFAILGIGCGAAVAVFSALRHDARLHALLLVSPPAPDAAIAAAIAPDITISAEGAHWLRAWLMVRDGQIYQPWFNGSVAAQRRDQGIFDAQWLHDQTCALMAGHQTYHHLPRAAWRIDTVAASVHATVPVHMLRPEDGVDRIADILLQESMVA